MIVEGAIAIVFGVFFDIICYLTGYALIKTFTFGKVKITFNKERLNISKNVKDKKIISNPDIVVLIGGIFWFSIILLLGFMFFY